MTKPRHQAAIKMWVGVEQDQNQEQILSGFGESNLRAESCSGNDGQLDVKRQKAETKSGPTEQLPKGWQRESGRACNKRVP